jgi:hypothetical protein
MSSHEISFNTDLSDPIGTQADFTYKITPMVISITDTGLGQRSVAGDIEAVLRKIETGIRARLAPSRSCAAMEKDSGTKFTGTAKKHLCLL